MSSAYDPSITDEMRERYLTRRQGDVVALEEALTQNDFKKMSAIGHQIKGNAATFSYEDLEQLAQELEHRAAAQTPNVRETIAAIKTWLARQLQK